MPPEPRRPFRVVIAPDSFKGSLTADRVAAALARGWRRARPDDELLLRPMADGGEGTIDAVRTAVPGARRVPIRVLGPADRTIESEWLRLPNGDAVVELAATSGLLRLERDERDGVPLLRPLTAHTVGAGEAIRAACEAGAERIHVGLGGSCSTDGGAGILTAFGARMLDAAGAEVPRGNIGLRRLARIDLSAMVEVPKGAITVWSDVDSPLTGPRGSAAVFGPQKGLDDSETAAADAGLARLAALLGVDPMVPGSGAAGGAACALLSMGASLCSGAEAVADTIGLASDLAQADLVITGEGRYDEQSRAGKAAWQVLHSATACGADVALVAGAIVCDPEGFASALSLSELAGRERSPFADAVELLETAGERLARGRAR